jgi:hypothetical protein
MAAGRSYDEVEDLTIFDLRLIFDYWAEYPAADEVLRAVYQVTSKRKIQRSATSEDDPSGIGGLIAAYPGGCVPADRPFG